VLNFLLTDEHFLLEIMKSSHPPMVDNQCGPRLLTTFITINLLLWVTESIILVSTAKMCRSHSSVTPITCGRTIHTKQHKSKLVKDTYCL